MSGSSTILRAVIIGGTAITLGGCELGLKKVEQTGYRGTGGAQIIAANRLVAQPIPAPPFELPADGGPTAGETYQNVPVLKNISTERFNYLMAAMNTWIAPTEGDPNKVGCNYCHNPENMASDEKYTKVVARRMLQMTQNINANWSSHVQGTGVTCWTCHRGNAVPKFKWATVDGASTGRLMGNKFGQNTPVPATAFASLPYDAFTPYLLKAQNIRVAATMPLRGGTPGASIKNTEQTYSLMNHMSSALNVNCTFCHNTDSFGSWSNSRSQRAVAWYGIRMVRDTNAAYINPLAPVFPDNRKGPHGDPYKVNCLTCHQGLNKPLGGVSMLKDYPMLGGAAAVVATKPATVLAADPNATAASCNADFDKALAGQTIEFDTGAATVRPVSTPLLNTLTQIAGRCSNFKMLVEGHTDAVGNAAKNQALSQDRAVAVEKYFTDNGVKADQIAAKGFGSTKPLDTSGTPAGNQRNRRIEISVAAK